MKRLQIGKGLTNLDGTVKKIPDGKTVRDITLKDVLLQTFETSIDVNAADALVLRVKVGEPLVNSDDEYLEMEDAIFTKLQNAYMSPKALEDVLPWVKAHIKLAFDEADDEAEE